MLNTIFNWFMTIGVYVFIGYLFWSAAKSILNRIFPPEQPPMIHNDGGMDYE